MGNLKAMLPLLVLIFSQTLNSLFKKQLSKAGYLCGYLEHEVSTHPDLGSPLDMSRNNGTGLSVSDLNLASVHSQRCFRLRATQQSFGSCPCSANPVCPAGMEIPPSFCLLFPLAIPSYSVTDAEKSPSASRCYEISRLYFSKQQFPCLLASNSEFFSIWEMFQFPIPLSNQ